MPGLPRRPAQSETAVPSSLSVSFFFLSKKHFNKILCLLCLSTKAMLRKTARERGAYKKTTVYLDAVQSTPWNHIHVHVPKLKCRVAKKLPCLFYCKRPYLFSTILSYFILFLNLQTPRSMRLLPIISTKYPHLTFFQPDSLFFFSSFVLCSLLGTTQINICHSLCRLTCRADPSATIPTTIHHRPIRDIKPVMNRE